MQLYLMVTIVSRKYLRWSCYPLKRDNIEKSLCFQLPCKAVAHGKSEEGEDFAPKHTNEFRKIKKITSNN